MGLLAVGSWNHMGMEPAGHGQPRQPHQAPSPFSTSNRAGTQLVPGLGDGVPCGCHPSTERVGCPDDIPPEQPTGLPGLCGHVPCPVARVLRKVLWATVPGPCLVCGCHGGPCQPPAPRSSLLSGLISCCLLAALSMSRAPAAGRSLCSPGMGSRQNRIPQAPSHCLPGTPGAVSQEPGRRKGHSLLPKEAPLD